MSYTLVTLIIALLAHGARASSNDTSQDGDEARDPRLTGDPQKDWEFDPNLPRELRGYNMSLFPFFSRVPAKIKFDCQDRIDGFYANVDYQCQVYHHCLYGIRQDFLCANYTAFDMRTFICQFINVVDCKNSDNYTYRNEPLYKATTTLRPERRPFNKVSEDYTDDYEYYEYYYDDYLDQAASTTTTSTTTTTTTTRPPTSSRPWPVRRRPGGLRQRRPQPASRGRGPAGRRRPRPQTSDFQQEQQQQQPPREAVTRKKPPGVRRPQPSVEYDYYYDERPSPSSTRQQQQSQQQQYSDDSRTAGFSSARNPFRETDKSTSTSRRRPATAQQAARPHAQERRPSGTPSRSNITPATSPRRTPFDEFVGENRDQTRGVPSSTRSSTSAPLSDYDYYDYYDDSQQPPPRAPQQRRGASTGGQVNVDNNSRNPVRTRPSSVDSSVQPEDSRFNELTRPNNKRLPTAGGQRVQAQSSGVRQNPARRTPASRPLLVSPQSPPQQQRVRRPLAHPSIRQRPPTPQQQQQQQQFRQQNNRPQQQQQVPQRSADRPLRRQQYQREKDDYYYYDYEEEEDQGQAERVDSGSRRQQSTRLRGSRARSGRTTSLQQ